LKNDNRDGICVTYSLFAYIGNLALVRDKTKL